jgi:hypothetical protein
VVFVTTSWRSILWRSVSWRSISWRSIMTIYRHDQLHVLPSVPARFSCILHNQWGELFPTLPLVPLNTLTTLITERRALFSHPSRVTKQPSSLRHLPSVSVTCLPTLSLVFRLCHLPLVSATHHLPSRYSIPRGSVVAQANIWWRKPKYLVALGLCFKICG